MKKPERRKSEPFFRKTHEYLASLSIETLVDPKFNDALSRLAEASRLLLRVSTLLQLYRDAFSKGFNGTSVTELEAWVDEMAKLEASLLAHRVCARGEGVLVSVATAREVISVYLTEKKASARNAARSGFARAQETFSENTFGNRGKTQTPPNKGRVEPEDEPDKEFVASQWQSQQQKRDAKKQRNFDKAEMLRDLTEKMRQFKSESNDKNTDTTAKAASTGPSLEHDFAAARLRAKPYTRKTLAWANAFLGLSLSTSLAEAKNIYYELARQWHPDVHPKQDQGEAQEAMVWLNDAWKLVRQHLQTKK